MAATSTSTDGEDGVSIHDQLVFSGITDCDAFVPNPFRYDKCKDCSQYMLAHKADAVPAESVMRYLSEKASKNGANLVLGEEGSGGCLYLGGYQASSAAFVHKVGITHVCNAARGLESFFVKWGKGIPELEAEGVQFLRLGWLDSPSQEISSATLAEAVEWIHTALEGGGNVAVHCAQGKSRSSTVVVAYLICVQNRTLDEALEFTRSKRPMAEPNSGFMSILKDFETSEECLSVREKLGGGA